MTLDEIFEGSSQRLDIEEERHATRIFLTARLKSEHRSWLDKGDKDDAEMTIDINPKEKSAHINQINAWMKHRGIGKELLTYALQLLKKEGYKYATAYTERYNFEPQSMNKKVGGIETERTEHGVKWKFSLNEDEDKEIGWEGISWRYEHLDGESPRPDDTPPGRTPSGDFIFYHRSDVKGAEAIVKEKKLRHDDLGYCGVATTQGHAMMYGTIKNMKTKTGSALLRVVIAKKWFEDHPNKFNRETGGSGKNQFLIRAKEVPLVDAKIIRVKGEDLEENDL